MQQQYNDAYECGMVNPDGEINFEDPYVLHRIRVRQGLEKSSGEENSAAPHPFVKR